MNDQLELTLPVASDDPESSAVQAAAGRMGQVVQGGAVVEVSGFGPYGEREHARVLVRGYLSDTPANRAVFEALRRDLLALPGADLYGEIQIRSLAATDWTEAWKVHYHPLRIGDSLMISPTWEQPQTRPGDKIIWLDPGMAFGTGTHPSTQLILRLLERYLRPGDTVLDVGTGSGILAIAALKLGAAQVMATDIDAEAVETARENAQVNAVAGERLEIGLGSVPEEGRYAVVCANILADVIADLLIHDDLAQCVDSGGILLLSGIIQSRRHLVDLALAARQFTIVDTVEDGDWLALAARRQDG